MISEAIYSLLSDLDALSSTVWDRIYCGNFEQDCAFPCVLFSIVSEDFSGTLGSPASTSRATVQIDAVSHSLSECYSIANAIRDEINGLYGDLYGVSVQAATLDSSRELHQQPEDGSDEWIYRVSRDYLVRYTVPPPEVPPCFSGDGA